MLLILKNFVNYCNYSSLFIIACEQALCLGKGWKHRKEREGKGWEPVAKHLGTLFHSNCCASDPDASSLLLARTLTVERSDLRHFFGWHIARDLIELIVWKQIFWSLAWRLLALDLWVFFSCNECSCIRGQITMTRNNNRRESICVSRPSVWNKCQKSHFLS